MEQALRDTRAKIRVTLTGADGAAVAADSGWPKVTITRDSDGTAIITDAATIAETGTGAYSYTLTPAQIPDVEKLTATWSATIGTATGHSFVTEVEVVGGYLCTLEAIDTATAVATTTDTLRDARRWAETVIEDACGVAFRPRYARETLDGPGGTDLLLSRRRPLALRSVTIGGTALTSTELAAIEMTRGGKLYRSAGWGTGREGIDVVYEHGYKTPPARISRACVRLARSYLSEAPSDYDERATRVDTDAASYSLITAGVRGAHTSIPEVNQAINEYSVLSVGVG